MSGSVQKQVVINLGFTLVKSIFILLSFRLADTMLSAQMMGLVLLFRRQGALWSNLAQLGFSQVLLKYYMSANHKESQSQLWCSLLCWLGVVLLSLLLACMIFAEHINSWLFPAAAPPVSAAFGLYVAGLALGFLANSSWLSEFRFVEANLIDWLHGSLLFVICLLIGSQFELDVFCWLLAGFTIFASLLSLWLFSRRIICRTTLFGRGSWHLEKKIYHYGFSRALTAYVDMATLVIGPWFLRDDLVQAAQLIAAYTVLRIAQTLVLPIAQVLALRTNSHHYKSNRNENHILVLAVMVFIFAWMAVAIYYEVGEIIVPIWIPNSSISVIHILDDLMPYMPGICVFYALRNHIDLKYLWPWNLVTLMLCIAAFIVVVSLSAKIEVSTIVSASKAMFSIFYLYSIIFFLLHFWNSRKCQK